MRAEAGAGVDALASVVEQFVAKVDSVERDMAQTLEAIAMQLGHLQGRG